MNTPHPAQPGRAPRARGSIELLEARIAPAAVFVTYTDVDGDLVKITASKAGLIAPPLDLGDLAFVGGGGSGQLAALNLTDAGFDGASIVFTVTKKPGGDGLAHVGYVRAPGVDLDKVIVKGDLGKVVAGDAITAGDSGLNSLSVRTMGTLGLLTQIGVANLNSVITGKLGALKVAGDFADASLTVTGAVPSEGGLGSVFIGGDFTGGADASSGRITCGGAMGNVQIGGGIHGGTGGNSGQIFGGGTMGDVRIGGDVAGGAGSDSGLVFSSDAMGKVRVAGDLVGGAGSDSGRIHSGTTLGKVQIFGGIIGGAGFGSGTVDSSGAMGSVRIGRDLVGGMGGFTGKVLSGGAIGDVWIGGGLADGTIRSSGAMGDVNIAGNMVGGIVHGTASLGDVRIGGNLIGGSIAGAASLKDSGFILSLGRIASVTISGSLIAGTDASTGILIHSGAIAAGDDLGPVKIGRSIIGNDTNPVLITARGQAVKPVNGFDTAIASVTVAGDVRFAKILAGFDQFDANADASIGAVSVGRDWVASSLVAGAQDAGAPGFGIGDTLQGVGNTPLIARIASIMIKGDVFGSFTGGDHFGFVAQQIGKLKVGPKIFALTAGPSNDSVPIPFTSDMRLLEVS